MLAIVALLPGLSPGRALAPPPARRVRCVAPAMGGSDQVDPVAAIAGSFLRGVETAAKGVKETTESYINSGWQVKKRAGQLIPEIRPNAVDVQARSEGIASLGAAAVDVPAVEGGLARPAPPGGGALTQSDGEMADEFVAFLSESSAAEGGAMRISEGGEVWFRSERELAEMVVGFTKAKLQALAVSARALARYVNDLESELEAADEAVVEMRRKQQEGQQGQAEAEARARRLAARSTELEAELSAASRRLADSEAEVTREQRAAERAAEELMHAQAALEAAARTAEQGAEQGVERGEGEGEGEGGGAAAAALEAERRRSVELEEKLISAEAAAQRREEEREELGRRQRRMEAEAAAAEARVRAEAAAVEALEQQLGEAERRADARSAALEEQLSPSAS